MSNPEKKREQSQRLFEALGNVDPELLERSEKTKKVVPIWKYSGMIAACFAFLAVGGLSLYALQMSGGKTASSQENGMYFTAPANKDTSAKAKEESAGDACEEAGAAVIVEVDAAPAENGSVSSASGVVDLAEQKTETEQNGTEAEKQQMGQNIVESLDGDMGGNSILAQITEQAGVNTELYYSVEDLRDACSNELFLRRLPMQVPEGYVFDGACVMGMKTPELEDDVILLFYDGGENPLNYGLLYAASEEETGVEALREADLTRELLEAEVERLKQAEAEGDYGQRLGILTEDGVLILIAGAQNAETVMQLLSGGITLLP